MQKNALYRIKTWATMLAPCLTMSSFSVNAETYLCIPEAGAYVSHDRNGKFSSGVADVSNMKLIQTNENGKWAVMKVGWDTAIFDKCWSPYYCENESGYAGAFLKNKNNGFSITWMPEPETIAVAKGMCTKIR